MPDKMSKISIVIPTYNRIYELERAINSVLKQSKLFNYEIIVLHNGPSTQAKSLIDSFNNSLICYFENKSNIGMTENWNQSIKLAKGEYVIMLHDDDELLDSYFEWLDWIFSKVNFDILIPPNNYDNLSKSNYYKLIKVTNFQLIFSNSVGPPVGIVINRKSLQTIFKSEYYPSIDYKFYSDISSYLRVFKVKGTPVVRYNIGVNESLKADTITKFLEKDKIIKKECETHNCLLVRLLARSYIGVYEIYYLQSMKQKFSLNFVSHQLQTLDRELTSLESFRFNIIKFIIRVYVYCNSSLVLKK